MLGSDLFRAAGLLAATAAGAAALAGFAPELRAAGVLPAPAGRETLVYTVIEMTERFDTRRACPLLPTMRMRERPSSRPRVDA